MNLIPAYPELWLLVMAPVVLIVDLFVRDQRRDVTYALALAALAGCAFWTLVTGHLTGLQRTEAFNRMFVADTMGHVLKMLCYVAVGASLVYSRAYLRDRGLYRGEYFALALFSTLGMMVMISANHFLSLYLGLELMSLSLYALVALNRDSAASTEAAMKYFVLGALASGLLLYGMSMIYGATGTLYIGDVAKAIGANQPDRIILLFGLVFAVSGMAFKLGVVPFHMWIPDVYHGAPVSVTLIIGSASKLAAFAMVVRMLVNGTLGFVEGGGRIDLLSSLSQNLVFNWQYMLVILAVLSMAIGNLAAIAQSNIKRMLAYSTISHMGFVLLGLLSGVVGNVFSAANAYSAALFYVIVYALMSLGAFGMILLLSRAGFEAERLDDFKGLNARSPWFAFVMMLLMFSLAGIPPTVGFYAKVVVLQPVLDAGQVWLAVVAVLFSLIGAFYYIRIVKLMYFDEPQDAHRIETRADMRVLLSLNGMAMLALGILPQSLMQLCLLSIKGL
ncbi:MAG TPA: NADH-quinone oxidoreductase subunit NuoN [Burkholderiales bacterium]